VAKKRSAKKASSAKAASAPKNPPVEGEEVVLDPLQEKALRLVDRSAKVRKELEDALAAAAAKVVRKVLKGHGIALSPAQADLLMVLWTDTDE